MGDYLWDKTGEPDAEVKRLEELLGQLRHERKPLALPPAAPAERHARRPFRFAYAAAAALLLAAMAGLWFGVVRDKGATTGRETMAEATNQTTTRQAARAKPTEETTGQTKTVSEAVTANAGVQTESASSSTSNALPKSSETPGAAGLAQAGGKRQARRAGRALFQRGARPDAGGGRQFARLNRIDGRAVASNTRQFEPTPEQQRAKEQLMLALRLTSARLSFVQKKTSAAGEERPSPREEQNKLR